MGGRGYCIQSILIQWEMAALEEMLSAPSEGLNNSARQFSGVSAESNPIVYSDLINTHFIAFFSFSISVSRPPL